MVNWIAKTTCLLALDTAVTLGAASYMVNFNDKTYQQVFSETFSKKLFTEEYTPMTLTYGLKTVGVLYLLSLAGKRKSKNTESANLL